jgi:hypothetical protein
VVIADVVTAELVPAGVRTIPFRLVAELAIAELLRTEAS